MECGDLSGGFRLGDWIVDPPGLRITAGGVCRTLDPGLMRILVCLTQRHGEVVDRETLRRLEMGGVRAVPFENNDLPHCIAAYNKRPSRFVRPADDPATQADHPEPIPPELPAFW